MPEDTVLRFERNNIPTFGEPVSLADLKIGDTYFFVHFIDDSMLIPVLSTVVYLGRNLEPNDSGLVYFQDAESYMAGIRSNDGSGEPCTISFGSELELGHVFDFDHALNSLLRCSIRRTNGPA